jgi:hypothetical protein
MSIILRLSNVCAAFSFGPVVGTKADISLFDMLPGFIAEHDTSKDRASGQHFIVLPKGVHDLVVAGVGKRTDNIEDYEKRMWRGRADTFLKRKFAAPVEGVAAIVYTIAAYAADPDVDTAELSAMLLVAEATHVLVALLAFAGPATPPAPWTFIRNLAGANNEALLLSGDEIRSKAKEVADYHAEWCVVTD